MARITHREPCSDDEDWSNVTDTNERRRIQNRNNQRAFRRRKVRLRQSEQMNVKIVRTSRAILLPKPLPSCTGRTLPLLPPPPPPPPENTPDSEGPQYDYIPAMYFYHDSPPTPSFLSMRSMIDQQLDLESYRVFHYASTSLWSLCQDVLDTNEHIGTAMTRYALSCPLTMDNFIWTAAMELEFHAHNPSNKKVLLKHQTRALRSIRQGIQNNHITDELVQAVYSLVTADQPPAIFQSFEEMMSGPSPYGDYEPPLTSLGNLAALCQMQFSENHAEVAVKLLASRGGLSSMNNVEFAYQIQDVDLIRNARHGCKPSFDLCKPYRHILETRMPLYRSSAFHSYPVSTTFNTLLLDLRTFLRQVDLYLTTMQPIVSLAILMTWRNINQHRLLSLPDNQDQLFRLTTLIFSYNVTFPVPYRSQIDIWTKELIPYIHEAPDTSEDALWAIVITAITLPKETIMNDLRTKARKIVKTLNVKTWDDLKTVLMRYLWLNPACEAGGVRFWKSISTSAESDAHHGVIETFRSLIECKRVYCL